MFESVTLSELPAEVGDQHLHRHGAEEPAVLLQSKAKMSALRHLM